ncbi:nitrilase family protein [Desulfolucanica intricata]|uniref:nitrilase family protein n=1 Tax=Desulfolucanica intricata TaxID=1285191 RepID=UPI00082F4DFF|nr:nitrilase family protein [Desulfolucanica intricata]
MKDIKIAVVQMQAVAGEIEKNLEKIVEFVNQAAAQKVDIICFPELCIQGYNRGRAYLMAEIIPGESSQKISHLAQDKKMTVLVGIAEKSKNDMPYITQLVAFPDGTLKKYRKTHLGKSERSYFTAGNDFPIFKTEKAILGVEICWDLHFPEVSTILALKGAEIIFAPHASPKIVGDRKGIWLKYLTARAYDNSVYLAACNLVGSGGGQQNFCGGALILDPKGNVIAEAFNDREELLVANLDSKLINTIRQSKTATMRNSFYLDARRPELYKEFWGK